MSQKQPLLPFEILFVSRNLFFWIPRPILHKKTSQFRLPWNFLRVKTLFSKVPQICPNSSLMTSYQKLTSFSDNGTTFFELSVYFYIRKHLLDNHAKRWKTSIVIYNHALNSEKLPKSEFLPQVTSSGPTLSFTPKLYFKNPLKIPNFKWP